MDTALETTIVDRLAVFATRFAESAKGRDGVRFRQPAGYGGATTGFAAKMTSEEFVELKAIMEDGKSVLIFEPFSMGLLDFSLRIYRHPPAPGTGPVVLFVVGAECLPDDERKVINANKGHGAYILDDSWIAYSPFSHTEENKKWLEKYRMEKAHHLDHYDY